jgi:hypothetical protein
MLVERGRFVTGRSKRQGRDCGRQEDVDLGVHSIEWCLSMERRPARCQAFRSQDAQLKQTRASSCGTEKSYLAVP